MSSPFRAPWQAALSGAFRQLPPLLEFLELEAAQLPVDLDSSFPLMVPRAFAAKMRKGDPRDPLLLQVLPTLTERLPAPGLHSRDLTGADGLIDPVGDLEATRAPGLLQKYAGRALLITTGACAVHCRYCFRRHFPYAEAAGDRLRQGLAWIREDPSLLEVILSGGDPLMLDDQALGLLLNELEAIAHLRRLRIHTRLPLMLPSRITTGLLERLDRTPLQAVMVIHANHPRELDAALSDALVALRQIGVQLMNQSVLLKGINDDVAVLMELSERLFAMDVMPYYLHQLDHVQGALHFEVPDHRALELHRALEAHLPGYLVPRLVREIAGADSKRPLAEVTKA